MMLLRGMHSMANDFQARHGEDARFTSRGRSNTRAGAAGRHIARRHGLLFPD